MSHEKLQKFTKFAPAAAEGQAPLELKRAGRRPRTFANFCELLRQILRWLKRIGWRLLARPWPLARALGLCAPTGKIQDVGVLVKS